MKIIFNHNIDDWWWQIYDEWSRNHELILPDNYKLKDPSNFFVDFEALEKAIRENSDSDFIFGFNDNLYGFIKWEKRKVNIPIVWFATNAIDRPQIAKMSNYAIVWYVEKYAKPLMEMYNRENLIYEGMAANPHIFHKVKTNKICDIGFIGRHYGKRGEWLDIIKNYGLENNINCKFPLANGARMYLNQKEINELYNQTKINLSFAPKNRPGRIVNLRTFEICMSGNFQLMQFTPCVEEYFEIDKEIVCWKNKKDLFEKISYYLENESEREKIAKNGYKRAIENHTWSKRIEKIGTFLKEKKELDIRKYIINTDQLLEKENIAQIQKFRNSRSNHVNFNLIEFILKKKGYNIKKNIKKKKSIKITVGTRTLLYKPNLKNFLVIEFFGKMIMIIKAISFNSEIILSDWEDLKKVLYLSENIDSSLPNFGLLTNGQEWIIYDFKNRKWLKNIPPKKALKARLHLINYLQVKILKVFLNYYDLFKFSSLVGITRFENFLKEFYQKRRRHYLNYNH